MPAIPATDIRARLIAGGVGSPALGAGDVYVGIEIPSAAQEGAGSVPDRAVFVREIAGVEPRRLHDGANYQQALVQVTVRSAKDAYAAGDTLARAVRASLERATLSTDYLGEGCEATQQAFAYIGGDELGRHRWVCTFRCVFVS